ncbi:myrcene synthase [Quercus suber]|uniref:Myrcene synthase n=1 Tax=Quercus suber TaxID=58331 RepID=A0AAW0KMV5_QUESU
MRNPLLLPTNQIYKQLNCKEYLRISLEKAEKELGGWRVKHCVTVTWRRGLAELGSVKWCVRREKCEMKGLKREPLRTVSKGTPHVNASDDELERGGVPKSVQCYMNETGASEEDAREYIRYLISETWKKMNEERDATSSLLETFIEIIFNLRRMAQCMY